MKRLLIFTSVMLCFSVFGQNCKDVPELNKQIVELTKQKLKKKVGRGECWDLAQYVLDETKADWDGFEVYGKLIDPKKECIFPGDIIQFEKIKISWKEGELTYKESMMHHTAIVVEVISKNEVIIAHQNTAQTGKKVGEANLLFDRITSGKLLIYRPVRKR